MIKNLGANAALRICVAAFAMAGSVASSVADEIPALVCTVTGSNYSNIPSGRSFEVTRDKLTASRDGKDYYGERLGGALSIARSGIVISRITGEFVLSGSSGDGFRIDVNVTGKCEASKERFKF